MNREWRRSGVASSSPRRQRSDLRASRTPIRRAQGRGCLSGGASGRLRAGWWWRDRCRRDVAGRRRLAGATFASCDALTWASTRQLLVMRITPDAARYRLPRRPGYYGRVLNALRELPLQSVAAVVAADDTIGSEFTDRVARRAPARRQRRRKPASVWRHLDIERWASLIDGREFTDAMRAAPCHHQSLRPRGAREPGGTQPGPRPSASVSL
jgi:hypothetical protein